MMVSPQPQMNPIPEESLFEHLGYVTSSPFRADELSDISFAAEATDSLASDDDDNNVNNENEPSDSPSPLKVIEIEKTEYGFGFNIVGGVDNPHFPGDLSIYISSVNPKSKSFGVVQTGDKILSFDGIDMTSKSHDEAVDVFRNVRVGHVAKMLIDRDYVLPEDVTQSMSYAATPSTLGYRENERRSSVKSDNRSMSTSESRGRLTPHGVATIVDRIRQKATIEEDDAQSTTSYAPSTHSFIDDVPRTPKKPLSLLDPRNNSLFTEALYVSIGLGALTLTGFLVYRFIRGRK